MRATATVPRAIRLFSRRQCFTSRHQHRYFSIAFQVLPRVQDALNEGRPVVALESTIVAHGMPFPQNLELSQELALILRSRGVEPATIALHKGNVRIGLEPDELHDLAESKDSQKCTTRQIGLFLSDPLSPRWGATTVASTMLLAHRAGIETFVTGGVGGVHRYGQDSMDISADLLELSRTPVIVVSAGIKSILDIARTLEVLESYSVPVVSYQTDQFPAFFSPNSGVASPARCETADQIASAFRYNRDFLGLSSGMLVGMPNSDPAGVAVEGAIQEALLEAEERVIAGPAVTPFILKRVAETTAGESLRSNISLVKQNAVLGAQIATALAQHRTVSKKGAISNDARRVVVMGGCVLDQVARPSSPIVMRTSNVASSFESDGGVARNIAEVLGRLGAKPLLHTAVGSDSRGEALLQRLRASGCDPVALTGQPDDRTATYFATMDHEGDLFVACADMEVMKQVKPLEEESLRGVEMLVLDSNPPVEVLRATVRNAEKSGVAVLWEPTSVPKAKELAQDRDFLLLLSYATPNLDEFLAMADGQMPLEVIASLKEEGYQADYNSYLQEAMFEVVERMKDTACLIVTLGKHGVMAAWIDGSTERFQHFPVKEQEVVNATGAGDSFTGAFVYSVLKGKPIDESINFGMKAAELTVGCASSTVSPSIGNLQLD